MPDVIRHVVESDVLVVGGAGAAVMSAVRAARMGTSVALVCKGKVGKSGNTVMIGGGFGIDGQGARDFCGEKDVNLEYTSDEVFKKLVTSGFYLGDQRIQKRFAEEAAEAVGECLNWARDAGQLFLFNPAANSWNTSGNAFGNTVRQGIRENPAIGVHEDMNIVALLKHGDRVAGALGIEVYSGNIVEFKAKAVVLATGGYQPFSLKNSHEDMAGDGIALGLRAGARVKDMEFLLHIGTIIEPAFARGSLLPFLMTFGFPLRPTMTDLDGVELVFPKDDRYKVPPTHGKVNKLLMAQFYGQGIFAKTDSHGNAFYYDYSAYSEEDIREAFRAFAEARGKWHRKGFYNGVDLYALAEGIIAAGKRMKVGFGNEYSMGGIVVDPDLSTDVPGLFAAGEVTSGTFGAFRSGDGLTEMLVHGSIAGRSAATYAQMLDAALEPENVDEQLESIFAPFKGTEGESPLAARRRLEKICDEGFDFFRSGDRLEKAYAEVVALQESLDSLHVEDSSREYNLEWFNYFIVRNLALCARIGIYAALHRLESRGTHLRADYPEVNNEDFLFSFAAHLEDGKPCFEKSVPVPYHIPHATKNYPSVADFIACEVLGGSK